MKIQTLSSEVINQIAAGEVVERPSHLAKELIENALDAGATEVEIEVSDGGRHVRVTDNGHGIASDELSKAFERHATSKIQSSFDLWTLSTFGFRGEALASIGAVSHLTLTSRPKDQDNAARMVCDFGKLSDVSQVGGSYGTTVEVRDLFENVPARLRFLKSEAAELGQIKNAVKAFGLQWPQVQFRLIVQGQTAFLWFPEDAKTRVQRLMDMEEIYEAEGHDGESHLRVYVSSPKATRSSQKGIWLFAQGRLIHDRALQAALLDAYRGLLMHGEYPSAVIQLQVPPEDIDVNIHPTKSQVRFIDGSRVFRLVQKTVRSVLEKAPWLPVSGPAPDTLPEDVLMARHEFTSASEGPSADLADRASSPQAFAIPSEFISKPLQMSLNNDGHLDRSFQTTQYAQKAWTSTLSDAATIRSGGISQWSRLQLLGQLRLTYIVAQGEDRLLLIDQHAAHERVAYERLMAAWMGGMLDIQSFLIPLTLDLEAEQIEALLLQKEQIRKFGIEVESVGPTSVAIVRAPVFLSDTAIVKGLSKMAEEATAQGQSFALERVVSDICATFACHSVVRAGQALSLEEMHEILAAMDEFALSSFCPHGRPVWLEWKFDEIEREFGRTQ